MNPEERMAVAMLLAMDSLRGGSLTVEAARRAFNESQARISDYEEMNGRAPAHWTNER